MYLPTTQVLLFIESICLDCDATAALVVAGSCTCAGSLSLRVGQHRDIRVCDNRSAQKHCTMLLIGHGSKHILCHVRCFQAMQRSSLGAFQLLLYCGASPCPFGRLREQDTFYFLYILKIAGVGVGAGASSLRQQGYGKTSGLCCSHWSSGGVQLEMAGKGCSRRWYRSPRRKGFGGCLTRQPEVVIPCRIDWWDVWRQSSGLWYVEMPPLHCE